MKKTSCKLISIILTLVLSTLALTGCYNSDEPIGGNHKKWNFYPEGYTAGFPDFMKQVGPRVEYWWVETYEECLAAIELLKSHDSTFAKTAIFTYEGNLFDTKYLFTIDRDNRFTEDIKFGDNPFDRHARNVEIKSYAFFDEVTIDEINYGDLSDYRAYTVENRLWNYSEKPNLTDNIESKWSKTKYGSYVYYVYDEIDIMLTFGSFGFAENPQKAKMCIQAALNTLVFLGFDE